MLHAAMKAAQKYTERENKIYNKARVNMCSCVFNQALISDAPCNSGVCYGYDDEREG